ncbi:putative LRR receptor-like serine/threonine-protein kinase [Camellia lanceoleosa]|uniref:LRR receptor-like serine/threonine-protein kinase n=1 Tax=Camellia lanceoleosa TaxID=1840588 RepID=A0ACC0H0W4_9ERIC|nr:putative LRR receptor-like serine/threonine-protein kinase [Camellia lanceoleosa]
MDHPSNGVSIMGCLRPVFVDEELYLRRLFSGEDSDGYNSDWKDGEVWDFRTEGDGNCTSSTLYGLEIMRIELFSIYGIQSAIGLQDFQEAEPDVLVHSTPAIVERFGEKGTSLTDLSYNNFFVQDVPCKETLNLFRRFSGGNLEINKCLGVSPCPKQDGYSLHINCGGGQTKVGNTMYIADESQGGTRAVPIRGIYGPLISAISIESNFKPHFDQRKKSLARALFGLKEWQLNLGWPTRLRICIGIARGLAFLHEESRLKIVHRDIKATNVLLDGDLNPKISDFGLAKLTEDDNTHISTRVAGTIGYMAPEYALWVYLTNKADVYSFGVVALEIAAGKDNMKFRPSDKYVCLLDWALVLQQKRRLMELVDPKLGPDFDKEEAIKMIKIALLYTNPSPALRLAMSAVISMLEGHLDIQDLVMDPSIYGDEYMFKSLKDKYDELQLQSLNEAQSLVDSMVTTQIGSSSASTNDLYQINLDSA